MLNDLGSVFDGSYVDPRDVEGMIRKHGCRFSSEPRCLDCIYVAIGDIQLTDIVPVFVKPKWRVYRSTMKHDFGKASLIPIKE